jgi:hypothetical protein
MDTLEIRSTERRSANEHVHTGYSLGHRKRETQPHPEEGCIKYESKSCYSLKGATNE